MQRLLLSLSMLVAACAANTIDPAPRLEPRARVPALELRAVRVAKFGRTFSLTNDQLPALEDAYLSLQRGMKKHRCLECHSGDAGRHGATSFETEVFELRHNIIVVLEANVMPPAEGNRHAGIADDRERLELLALARAFESAGDAALAKEIELP